MRISLEHFKTDQLVSPLQLALKMKENKIVNICCKIAKPDHRLMIHVSEAFYQLLYEESDLFPQRTIIKIGNKRLFDPLVPRSALRK